MNSGKISERTIERLSLYRRLLLGLQSLGITYVFSHQLAEFARVTAAQVRRDLMSIGYSGSTHRGYEVKGITESLAAFLDRPGGQGVALIGIGQLGRALLNYFVGRRPNLSIVAAFDVEPSRLGDCVPGCRCYLMDELETVLREEGITVAIVAVPGNAAQPVAERLVAAGIRGILNFAPVRLSVPRSVFVDNLDLTTALEKVAYYACKGLDASPAERRRSRRSDSAVSRAGVASSRRGKNLPSTNRDSAESSRQGQSASTDAPGK